MKQEFLQLFCHKKDVDDENQIRVAVPSSKNEAVFFYEIGLDASRACTHA